MRSVVLVTLAACGRLGFDEAEPPPIDELRPALCDVVDVGTVALTGAPLEMRLVEVQGEIAVLVGTDAGNIYAIRVTAATRTIASVHLPLAGGYVLQGGGALGGNVFVYTNIDVDAYLKRLDPSWDTYVTMQSGSPGPVDPMLGLLPGRTTAIYGSIVGGQFEAFEIDASGTATGVNSGLAEDAKSASIASSNEGARAVYSDGIDCVAMLIDASGVVSEQVGIEGCVAPQVIAMSDGRSAVVHASTSKLVLTPIASATIGTTVEIAGEGYVRTTVVEGAAWVGYPGTSGVQLARVDDTGIVVGDVAAKPPFDLAPTIAVWLDGSLLRAGRPCLEP